MALMYGEHFLIHIFGESHGEAVGATIEGLPAGMPLDMDALEKQMEERKPGQPLGSKRKERDRVEIISGLWRGRTCGTPLTLLIRNEDADSSSYEVMADTPRPGHADYTAHIKYGGFEDYRGGGTFSGRLTAPLTAAGAIAEQIGKAGGVAIRCAIDEIGGQKEGWEELVRQVQEEGDSVGGVIACSISGLPTGLGGPFTEGIEGKLASLLFAIPAVKGVEFGSGFRLSRMRGSQANDPYRYQEEEGRKKISILSNHAGGILGGISTGQDICLRVAFKPTPSIAKEQASISYACADNASLKIKGRHDPCLVLRALPVVRAAVAIVAADLLLASDRAKTWPEYVERRRGEEQGLDSLWPDRSEEEPTEPGEEKGRGDSEELRPEAPGKSPEACHGDEASKRLAELRRRIDDVDRDLRELLEKRFSLASDIGKIKKERSLPLRNKKREEQILIPLRESENREVMEAIYREILKQSRLLQAQDQVKSGIDEEKGKKTEQTGKTRMKVLIINGPNMNMLGIREKDIYGGASYEDLVEVLGEAAREMKVDCRFYRSNHEGDIIDTIQEAYGAFDGIIINPAAYTHTSIAIADALRAVAIPTVEVHISDTEAREDYRKISYISKLAVETVKGEGIEGYIHALKILKRRYNPK